MNSFERLGVSSNASADEIKSAYRKLAKIYHPDSPSGKGDGKIFNEITIAYKDALEKINKSDEFYSYTISEVIDVSVKESLYGFTKIHEISDIVQCDCGSIGAKCLRCKGDGFIRVGFAMTKECPRCKGYGFENPHECYECRGSGSKLIIEPVKIAVEGMIKQGEMRSYNFSKGKLMVKFNIKKTNTDIYDRDGDDLIYVAQISPLSAILGGTILVPRVNDESAIINYPENCKIPSYYKIPNSGVPGTRGSMLVMLKVNNELMNLSLIPKIREALRRS